MEKEQILELIWQRYSGILEAISNIQRYNRKSGISYGTMSVPRAEVEELLRIAEFLEREPELAEWWNWRKVMDEELIGRFINGRR